MIAQEIERYHLEDEFSFHEHDLDGVPGDRRLHLHPYSGFFVRRRTSRGDDNVDIVTTSTGDEERAAVSNALVDLSAKIYSKASQSIRRSIDENDWVRSATMGVWAICFYTPAYMALYAAFDRVFQKRTPFAIGSRVVGAVIYSIPVNALFFFYGTSVHHTLEWYGLWDSLLADAEEEAEWVDHADEKEGLLSRISKQISDRLRFKRGETSTEEDQSEKIPAQEHVEKEGTIEEIRRRFFLPLPDRPPPFDMDMLLSKARLKIETELVSTVKTSAQIWVPINFFNFTLVPNHLRPFGLLFFSVFWNCYLSLVQHRDVPLPT